MSLSEVTLTPQAADHLARIKAAVTSSYDLSQVPKWICDHTFLKGAHYSFLDHEFQEIIASDTSQIVNVFKCSQIGMSELMARWIMGVCEIFPAFGAILTFPFSGDAEDFCRSRIDPFITTSARLLAAINPKINNSEMKQIHESFLYMRGTNGKTQAISTPADAVVSDEIDRSDPDTLAQFTSRLKHSSYKLRRNFSTPTIEGWGIALEMETSRRFKNLCKCNHCNHWFLPEYYKHVKIPGFSGDLRTITKTTLPRIRYLEAYLGCPGCGKAVDLSPVHRNYVQENIADLYEAAGYYVSPFDAPKIVTPTDLIKTSTQYAKRSEFDNQELGKTSLDTNDALVLSDLTRSKTLVSLEASLLHGMGIDVGLICTITVGRLTLEGKLLVVHRELVPLGKLEERKAALKSKFSVAITVMDSMPYTDLVMRMQAKDKNLFGGFYNNTKNAQTFGIKMFEGDVAEGKMPLHLAQIRRDAGFDELMGLFKNDDIKIYIQDQTLDEVFDKHMLDMKRVQLFDENKELRYTWVKSKNGEDHFHHSMLYLLAALRLRGVVTYDVPLLVPGMMPMRRFSTNTKKLVGGRIV